MSTLDVACCVDMITVERDTDCNCDGIKSEDGVCLVDRPTFEDETVDGNE